MYRLFLITVSLFTSMNCFSQSSNDKILGKWTNKDKTRVIEFIKNGSVYDAIIRKSEKNTSIIGKKQITSLKSEGKDSFDGGTVHIFQRNKEADCSAKLLSENQLEIKASLGFMSKSEVWTKL